AALFFGLSTGFALEDLVQRALQRVVVPDLAAELNQNTAQQRVRRVTAGSHDVDRLDIEQSVTDREGQQVAGPGLGIALPQQRQLGGDLRIGLERVRDLTGTVDLRVAGHPQRPYLPIVVTSHVGVDRHERDQVLPALRRVRGGQREVRLLL